MASREVRHDEGDGLDSLAQAHLITQEASLNSVFSISFIQAKPSSWNDFSWREIVLGCGAAPALRTGMFFRSSHIVLSSG